MKEPVLAAPGYRTAGEADFCHIGAATAEADVSKSAPCELQFSLSVVKVEMHRTRTPKQLRTCNRSASITAAYPKHPPAI